MKPEPKPFRYPFENPSMTVGLAAINATETPFRVEPRHLNAWLKEGTPARYMLMDDIRELWNREGFLVEVGRGGQCWKVLICASVAFR
ncbi:MAG: hypothetical protein E6559_20740 [Pantoea sp.]|uniref:hypothetical protein n=1 Tax=Pantoea septica TaxID=472695 RepID=UPI0028A01C53|nr:hypothetical protein [Pantoea septica]MDU6442282.1 hypothetical protein [Pantoea sp.]